VLASHIAIEKLRKIQEEGHVAARRCNECNLCFEDSSTYAPLRPTKHHREIYNTIESLHIEQSHLEGVMIPLANCSCIDCPNTSQGFYITIAACEPVL